jgi:hypothetical protein
MKEPHIQINPLIHNFLVGQPPTEPIDIICHLNSFLFELDALTGPNDPISTSFISSDTEKRPILELAANTSVQSAFDVIGRKLRQPAKAIFMDTRKLGCEIQPRLKVRELNYCLFAVVREIGPGQYVLFLSDANGWLSICDDEIFEVDGPIKQNVVLVG